MSKKVLILFALATLAMVAVGTVYAVPGKSSGKTWTANTIAVCGCGKVFVPNSETQYLTVNGKQYACCTQTCHAKASAMAAKDPAGFTKHAETVTAQNIARLTNFQWGVQNVTGVSEEGTTARCGCGMEFTVSDKTEYITYDGKSYACCTHQCHEMAAKDPAKAVQSFQKQMTMTSE